MPKDFPREEARILLDRYIARIKQEPSFVHVIIDSWTNNTALHLAVMLDDVEAVKMLIENGADVNRENSDGESAIALALEHKKMGPALFMLNSEMKKYAHLEDKDTSENIIAQDIQLTIEGCKVIAFIQDLVGTDILRNAGEALSNEQLKECILNELLCAADEERGAEWEGGYEKIFRSKIALLSQTQEQAYINEVGLPSIEELASPIELLSAEGSASSIELPSIEELASCMKLLGDNTFA